MPNTRGKLIELLKYSPFLDVVNGYKSRPTFEMAADHLIANGVTVHACKLGNKIYQTDGVRIYESTIGEITITAKHTIFVTENIAFDERAIGKSIFLSHEEAEAHLLQPPKGE